MAMKTIVLDSSPSINLHDPSNIPLNVSPAYINRSKNRGQPILGQKQVDYTYFVPMGSGSDHIKELLALEETDNSEAKPIEASDELLKAEKMIKGEEKPSSSEPPFDSSFEKEAKQFMDTPQTHKEDTFQVNDDESADTSVKNDSDFANLIAASQPKKSNYRKPSKPRRKKPAKKAPPKKIKKMKKFRIIRNKK